MKGRALGILLLLAWGIAKFPVEARLEQRMQDARLGGFKPTASLRQQAGQAGFIAALGGLRAAVADMLWIRAHVAWQDVQYGRMKLLFDTCTAMQPRRVNFWDIAAWHMAWNGSVHVENSDPDPVDLPIPGNDDSIRSIEVILAKLADACLEGRAALPPEQQGQMKIRTPQAKPGAAPPAPPAPPAAETNPAPAGAV